jgi:regulatory protein
MLQQKGVSRDDVDAALAALAAKYEDSDIAAACNYARRRQLGPHRLPEAREEFRERDLAVLARAGFGYVTARHVTEAQSVEDLETNALA